MSPAVANGLVHLAILLIMMLVGTEALVWVAWQDLQEQYRSRK